ncbi:dehydrogenase [Pseudonocardia asaccharolytica DSM 44247 = NBRC 16224]|uniref:Pyridine nucleotide-disulfide oxidoreductase domain-containing protein 2 n=1 Tax=Pseudonocardia asaccharolytica DSM 44247 = NBRC 16224 TaxID=1123024 RepID=A0A511CV67_9PSEU|nr:dehydrogenase [Pseudonocardia asaccharolytica DSM 44247 = NBRC 16224]
MGTPDAVVIGAGPNGLVAANILADAGWQVVVCEEQPEPGGGVRSGPGPADGFVYDHCSAFYPMAISSRAIGSLELERYGLRWLHADEVLAHPLPDGRAAVLSRDLHRTAEGLDELAAGDGAAWRRLYGLWEELGPHLLDALFVPFPPIRTGLRLVAKLRLTGLLRFTRFALLPVRRLAEEEFSGPAALLLAGCALHADLMPESAGSTVYGWLLAMLGHQYGWPVPEGGSGQLTAALVRRLEQHGGVLRCGDAVRQVVVRGGRAVAVRTASGEEIPARRAVLAATAVTQLYGGLVGWEHLPPRLRDDLRRFQWDYSTFKVDWALRAPVPWQATGVAGAGTVHVAASLDEMTEYTAQISMGRVPARPFLLAGQMTTADPCRSPRGTESLWAYTHVPRRVRGDAGGDLTGSWDEREREAFADRLEAQIERYAPGWRELVIARRITAPGQLQASNANLVGGAINGGTTSVHQQLVFRPTPGLGRPETPIAGLYLASSSAHPGGAVHGACGANAARAALHATRAHAQRAAAAGIRLGIGR